MSLAGRPHSAMALPGCRCRRELRDGGGRDVQAGVQGWQRAVDELRVAPQQLLRVVEVALLDGRFVTDSAQLGFELGEVLSFGDAEVVVGVLVLLHAVGRVRCSDGQNRGRPVSDLRLPELADRGGLRACH